MQAPLQIIILLLHHSQTATVGGLETVFNQGYFGFNPETALILSISWSLISCAWTHTYLILTEKGFYEMKTSVIIFLWSMFAAIRRVLSIVTLFIPSMGLFSLLYHWKFDDGFRLND